MQLITLLIAPALAQSPQLLIPGSLSSLGVSDTGERWQGLFPGRQGFELRHLDRLSIDHRYAEGKSWMDVKVQDSPPLFLVRGLEDVVPGPVVTTHLGSSPLDPSEQHCLAVGERERYLLRRDAANQVSLHLEPIVPGVEGSLAQILSDEGEVPVVLWAGDLDHDGELDLLTTVERSSEDRQLRLWLSSARQGEELLGVVATLDYQEM